MRGFVKKALAVCLLIMLAVVLPAGVLAEFKRNVNVLGVNVNTGNAVTYWKVITETKWNTQTLTNQGASADDYNVKYDRMNHTLTLKNISAPNASGGSGNSAFISVQETQYIGEKYTIKVVLEGTNTFAKPNYTVNNGITGGKGISLEVGGSGTLNVSNVLYGVAANGDDGGSVTITGGKLNINSQNTGVRAYSGNVYIHGGAVNITINNTNSDVTGIFAGGKNPALISVKDAELIMDVHARSGVNLFRSWNADGNRQIVFENAYVLARTDTNYGHRCVFSAQPSVTGGTAYIGPNYDGSEKAAWNGTDNVAYDIVSFNGSGKGSRYLEILPAYTVTVIANPPEGGQVSGGGTYDRGETATVSAQSNAGYEFVNWTEDGVEVSSEESFSFTVMGNRTLVANFRALYIVTYTDGVEDETVFDDQIYTGLHDGDATPAFEGEPVREGYTFCGWTPAVEPTVTGNAVYTATWTPKQVNPDPDQDPDKDPNTPIPELGKLPKTGDASDMGMWMLAIALSMLGLFGLKRVKMQR